MTRGRLQRLANINHPAPSAGVGPRPWKRGELGT
ncbi:hypothetical protein MXAN_5226 [Myxococcus xanthus DK 1622]|uniref:Uncharacterized protein n=1 Tax=Myxococcus xanthus (strain DK1622) TaxID=246197 RepID=Q1D1U5_MYXXD|nr:hypothetical protein MXAN_5226 [Myxococcus xanthus DK 1622]